MVAEAAAAAGALARHLTWSHYHRTLATLMRQLGRDPVREKPISLGLCSVLDAFHFNVVAPAATVSSAATSSAASAVSGSGDAKQQQQAAAVSAAVASVVAAASTTTDTTATDAAEDEEEEQLDETSSEPIATSTEPGGDGVWRALTVRIMPALRTLLTREEAAKGGGKEKVLRAPVALALLKLLLRLPQSLLDKELSPLLLSVCSGLKSKDSSARDAARGALAAMARDLGARHLQAVASHLRTALHSGYQLHVRTFTLCAVLQSLAAAYSPPLDAPSAVLPGAQNSDSPQLQQSDAPAEADVADAAATLQVPVLPELDSAIPLIVELCMEDLFGEAGEARDSGAAVGHISKTKEAKGAKACEALGVLASMLLFRPTYTALEPANAAGVSSVHALVSPKLLYLNGCESRKNANKGQ